MKTKVFKRIGLFLLVVAMLVATTATAFATSYPQETEESAPINARSTPMVVIPAGGSGTLTVPATAGLNKTIWVVTNSVNNTSGTVSMRLTYNGAQQASCSLGVNDYWDTILPGVLNGNYVWHITNSSSKAVEVYSAFS